MVRIEVDWWRVRFFFKKVWKYLRGYKVCPKCYGYGAVERLDSGYMLKFGLRPWDGCSDCGGHRDTRGSGFIVK